MMTSSTSMTQLTTDERAAGRAERQSMGGKMYARNAKMNRVLDRSKKIEKAALQIQIQLQAVNMWAEDLQATAPYIREQCMASFLEMRLELVLKMLNVAEEMLEGVINSMASIVWHQ